MRLEKMWWGVIIVFMNVVHIFADIVTSGRAIGWILMIALGVLEAAMHVSPSYQQHGGVVMVVFLEREREKRNRREKTVDVDFGL